MWFLRRLLRISWTQRVTNEEVLARAKGKITLLETIKSRKMKFLGYVMRRKGTENLAVTGKIEGKRARDRQKMPYMSKIKDWTDTTKVNEVLLATYDRQRWKCIAANALTQDTLFRIFDFFQFATTLHSADKHVERTPFISCYS